MRHALKATLVSLLMLGGVATIQRAAAADLGGYRKPSVFTSVSATDWSGLYGGLHLGYATGRAQSANLSGSFTGVHAGYNLQAGTLVVGVETDLNYAAIDYHGFADSFRQKWSGDLRGRVGVSYDRMLPFITAGMGFTNATMKSGGAKSDNTHTGLVVGAGVEYRFTEKFSGAVQYLYHRDSTKTYAVLPLARNTGMNTNEVRVGFNYHF